jgi:hypothetical protein
MVLTLERAGFIKRQPRGARSIELLVDPKQFPRATLIQHSTGQIHRFTAVLAASDISRFGGGIPK